MNLKSMFLSLEFWELCFYLFCAHRYVRLFINCLAHWSYKSLPKPEKPKFSCSDVTVIIPTIESNVANLEASLRSILACDPHQLILVTTSDKYVMLWEFARALKDARILVLQTRIANKRLQLREAIPHVQSHITVLVDDDVTWPKTALPWILAPFEMAHIGSVGVCQKVRRDRSGSLVSRCFNWLGADYIERRNFEISATHRMDGGTSCMSGRTNALRTEILRDYQFLHDFCNEKWGTFHLNADDDNFVTRWLVNHGWSTWIQYHEECMIETTLENNPTFLKQCLRWARSNWRSNWTSLMVDRLVWTKQPWSTYAIYTATFTSLGLVADPLFFFLYYMASSTWISSHQTIGWCVAITWYLFTKIVKRVGLLRRHPSDIVYIPVSVIFGLCHGLIKIYALLTWNVTSWGSRPDGDADDNQRMTPQVLPSEVMARPPPGKKGLVRYEDESCDSKDEVPPPLYEAQEEEPPTYDVQVGSTKMHQSISVKEICSDLQPS